MKYTKTVGALVAATGMLAGYATAELEGEVHVGYNTEYIWRGVELGQDMAEAGVDLAYDLGNGFNVSGGAWYASFDDSLWADDELDLYAEVSKDFGWATFFTGYIYYMNGPHTNKWISRSDDAQEVYFGFSRELFWGIDASLAYYWDIVGDNGGYTELGLEKSVELSPCLTWDNGVKLGYMIEEGGLSHLTVMTALNWNFWGNATVSPYLAYSWELDELDTVYGPQEDHFFGGVKLTVKF